MEKSIENIISLLFVFVFVFLGSSAFAAADGLIEAPEGMKAFLTIIPIIVILVLLFRYEGKRD